MNDKPDSTKAELERVSGEADEILDRMGELAREFGTDSATGRFVPLSPEFADLAAALKEAHQKQTGLRAKLIGMSIEEYRSWLADKDGHFDLDASYKQIKYTGFTDDSLCIVYSAFDKHTKMPVLVVDSPY